MTKDPFDFSDVSDLPEELAKKLTRNTSDETAKTLADIIRQGAEAGHDRLDINQITAAAQRMGIKLPSQQTVRKALNRAVEMKLVKKPTKLTYGLGSIVAKKEDAGLTEGDAVTTQEVEEPQVTSSVDPLADL